MKNLTEQRKVSAEFFLETKEKPNDDIVLWFKINVSCHEWTDIYIGLFKDKDKSHNFMGSRSFFELPAANREQALSEARSLMSKMI